MNTYPHSCMISHDCSRMESEDMRKIALAVPALILALGLTGCSDPSDSGDQSGSATSGATESTDGAEGFDFSKLTKVDEVAALVPEAVSSAGVLRNAASTDYPPGEFLADDGQIPIGYDVDIIKALALVMGLEDGTTSTQGFDTIIPALGTKFDVGASSFTITPERINEVNMVSYLNVGSSYGVAAGNPSGFDPSDPCGQIIGVQTGTFQFDYVHELSEKCVEDGKEPIDIKPHDLQSDVTTKVVGGQYTATFADAPVVGWATVQTDGQIEEVGEVVESLPQGIAIAKTDEELTNAVQAGMQYLMDEGYLTEILSFYGSEGAGLDKAEINPAS